MDTYRIYEKLSEPLGEKAAGAMAGLLGDLIEEVKNTVTKADFSELKGAVRELVEAQKRTEQRIDELAEAQKRTEQRIDELAEAQARSEVKIEELAQAQKSTEERLDRLAELVHEGFADIHRRFGVLGSRWGDGAEEAFRQGLLKTVSSIGYSVSRYEGQDPEGFINGRPRSYDLDILVHNGKTIAAEVKSNASGADVTEFARIVELFQKQTGRPVSQSILVAVTIQERAWKNAEELGVTVATDFSALKPRKTI